MTTKYKELEKIAKQLGLNCFYGCKTRKDLASDECPCNIDNSECKLQELVGFELPKFENIEQIASLVKAMLEASPVESEPVGEVVIEKDTQLVSDKEMGGSTDTYSYIEVARTRVNLNCSLDVGTKLYTHPPADKSDAERYRWLREQNAILDQDSFVVLAHDCTAEEEWQKYWVGSDLDEAIDKAMKG